MRGFRPERPEKFEPEDNDGEVEYTVHFQFGTIMTPQGPVNVMPITNLVRFLHEVAQNVDEDALANDVLTSIAHNFSRII